MTAIVIKKRKFNEPEEDFYETPRSKITLSVDGKTQKSFENYFRKLEIMFPNIPKQEIRQEFSNSQQDFLLTMERLKSKQALFDTLSQASLQGSSNDSIEKKNPLQSSVETVIQKLLVCSGQNEAYKVLMDFGQFMHQESKSELGKLEAENYIVKKAFKAQNKIVAELVAKEQSQRSKIECLEKQVQLLSIKVRDQELCLMSRPISFNNNIC